MPSLASSSSIVFGRFRRQHELNEEQKDQAGEESEGQEKQRPASSSVQQKHRRESSLLSLSSSVTDFRRSVSLRSSHQRSQLSGQRFRNHSTSNLLQTTTTSPTAPTSIPSRPQQSQHRQRSESLWSVRPLSGNFRSSETLPILPSDQYEHVPDVPPLTASIEPNRKTFSMLAVAPIKRQINEKQAFAAQTSQPRDALSAQYGGEGSALPSVPLTTGSQNPQFVYQQIQETAAKRMATIRYLRRVYEGDVYFFNTIHFSHTTLASLPSMHPQKIGRRALSYFTLGYSLPSLLDMNNGSPLEFLKPITALLQEFETYQSLAGVENTGSLSRGRVGQMFKSGMGLGKGAAKARRASTATEAFSDNASLGLPASSISAASTPDLPSPVNPVGYEFTYLLTPQVPFDPDFGTAFSTLCDTLIDMYSSLLNIVTGPEVCSTGVAEAFSKADKTIRKILVSNAIKEFEEQSRSGAKAEVAGLSRLVLGGLM